MDTTIPGAASLSAAENPSSALAAVAVFLRRYWLQFLAISAALAVPCFWHVRIEAGDLPSHVYNAWLAQLIERGQLPGLWIAHQWNNVLFDLLLLKIGNLVGLNAAQKIVVPIAVLIFFWGALALVCAIGAPRAPQRTQPQVPWLVAPCLAMFAYGWTFEMGFMNYYISIGLAFFALAILHRGRGAERLLSIALLPLIWLAHPLGVVLLVVAGAYLLLAARLSPQRQLFVFLAAALLILIARLYIAGHYEISWRAGPRVIEDGTDQLHLYGVRYLWLCRTMQGLVCGLLACDVLRREKKPGWWTNYLLPLQLYALALLAATLLPSVIRLPQFAAPLGLLTERLTSVSAVLLCCLLAAMKPRRWHILPFAALALIFSVFLYQDTGTLNRMESQTEQFVRLLPPGQRVLATIWRFPGSRVFIQHIVDRACIGQCFSYDNYEPSSGQFRVRSNDGNPYVLGAEDSDAAQGGAYILQPRDLPAFQIYQCNLNMTDLCMRELAAGEANGAVGVRPNR